MKHVKLFLFVLILLTAACHEDEPLYADPANLQEEIENIIQPLIDGKKAVGAAVGVIMPGGQKTMYFFGEKTKGYEDVPDANTLFEIGSINKTMTGAVLADMVLKSEISLDDDVEDFLPGIYNFPRYNGEKIKFKHLANQTSSLPRLPGNVSPGEDENPFAGYTKTMLYDFLNGYILPRPIGSEEEYSNLAFGLLGHALAEIKGTSFGQQMSDVIFDQLGMTNTYNFLPINNENIAQPYDQRLKAVPVWDFSDVMLGAGGVVSSLKDMLTYLEANMGYGSSDLRDALALSHQNTQSLHDPIGIGLAWINAYNETNNSTLTQHNGRTIGSNAFIGFINELDLGVVLLFNSDVPGRTGELGYETRKAVEIFNAMQKY